MKTIHSHNVRGWSDGVIVTDDGDALAYPGLTLSAFQATQYWQRAKVTTTYSGDQWCVVRPVLISGHECTVSLEFVADRLDRASILITEDEAKKLGVETGYMSPRDGAEVAFMKNWVAREVGREPQIQCSWGTVTFQTQHNPSRVSLLGG